MFIRVIEVDVLYVLVYVVSCNDCCVFDLDVIEKVFGFYL